MRREGSLCLFSLSVSLADNKVLVVELWDSSREEGGWTPLFIRSFND